MKKWLAIIVMLSLCLTACGKDSHKETMQEKEQQTEIQENIDAIVEEKNWIIEEQILPDADTVVMDLLPEDSQIFTDEWHLVKETVYRLLTVVSSDETASEDEWFKGHCVQKLVAPYIEWKNVFISSEDWVAGECCEPWSYSSNVVMEDGVAILLEGENGAYLGEWNEEGTRVTKIDNNILTKEIFSEKYGNWKKDQSGGLYLWGENEYIRLDSNFAVNDKLESEDGYYVSTVIENNWGGEFYLVSPTEIKYDEAFASEVHSGIEMISLDEKETILSSADIYVGEGEEVFFSTEKDGYLYQNFCITEFSLATGTINVAYDFHDDMEHFDIMYNEQKPLNYMSIRNGIQGGYMQEEL